MNSRKNIVFILLALVLVVVGFIFISNYLGSEKLTVDYKNTAEVVVYTKENFLSGKTDKKEAIIKNSSETLRIKKGEYVVSYTGEEGFANDNINVDLRNGEKNISIDPYFSDDKLAGILVNEQSTIKNTLTQQIPSINLYLIQPGRLYKFGEWYATTLLYNGNDPDNSDTLRLVMKKENGSWVLKTNPPQITISRAKYSEIPLDILNNINNEQKPDMQVQYQD